MMGTYINIGNAGFQSVRNGEYVDKSGLIEVGINYDRETKTHNCRIEYTAGTVPLCT